VIDPISISQLATGWPSETPGSQNVCPSVLLLCVSWSALLS